MWHDKKNTQLKHFLQLHSVWLICSKVTAPQILHGGITPFAHSKNWIKVISIHLIRETFPVFYIDSAVKKSQGKPCLPNWFTKIFRRVTEEILLPKICFTEWISIGYCKKSDFFWLIFSVSSLPPLTSMRFPHSSSMSTSLGESSKFPMSYISMQSSSSSTVTFFSEELIFLTRP